MVDELVTPRILRTRPPREHSRRVVNEWLDLCGKVINMRMVLTEEAIESLRSGIETAMEVRDRAAQRTQDPRNEPG